MSGRAAREVDGRVLIAGRLVLETPAHFGNGDIVGVTDMPLLRDPRDGVTPLLTGASVAGALRSYLREIEHGYGATGGPHDLAERLFGRLEDDTSLQSWLMVDDALGVAPGIELRDGVALDPVTRTAEDRKKYDIELLAAGTAFDVHIELLRAKESRDLLPALAAALDGLARGEIGLGQRKRRGLGRCRVTEWRVRSYDLNTPAGLLAWLADDAAGEQRGADIYSLLGAGRTVADQRSWFRIETTFGMPGSLLIRSGGGEPGSPDMVHLRSSRPGRPEPPPIVSGTSLAGAVRARALRIANTVVGAKEGRALVEDMFGHMHEDEAPAGGALSAAGRPKPGGSRVVTEESVVANSRDLVQSRVKIDRFTGGAFPDALFSEQPVFGGAETAVRLSLTLRNPGDAEIGLLLLVLKDLWTGDLPLGGESGVGRGRLQGQHATLVRHAAGRETTWELRAGEGESLAFGGDGSPKALEDYVAALWARRRTQ
jgi:CRISPR/Cas system CSM-associated protein Csm3 (group 7 of RAMP superfamily)